MLFLDGKSDRLLQRKLCWLFYQSAYSDDCQRQAQTNNYSLTGWAKSSFFSKISVMVTLYPQYMSAQVLATVPRLPAAARKIAESRESLTES